MDGTVLRHRLREASAELNQLETRREALTNIIKGYEQLIRLDGIQETPTAPEPPEAATMPLPTPKRDPGAISFRGAVQKVLRDARGEPLHIKEIYGRAVALGATSTAKEPVRVTDLLIYSLIKRNGAPIEKTAPATYRWSGSEDEGPTWMLKDG